MSDIKNNQKKKQSNNTSKEKKVVKPLDKKPKINYKKKYEKEVEKNLLLNSQITTLEFEKLKSTNDFKELAKTFEKKAQTQVNKLKKELHDKLNDEILHVRKFGAQKLLEDIMDKLLNIELAITSNTNPTPEVQAYVMGFKMLIGQVFQTFEQHHITFIEPKIGDAFDPKYHEAFSTTKNGAKIITIKRKGFMIHDRIVNPAIVELD